MKVVLLGNAGAGKTTLARALMGADEIPCLALDEVAFLDGAVRRPLVESIAAVREFIGRYDHWILEGCYSDIIEPILGDCEALVFLNPGVATCIQHCRERPWEPEKFASPSEQLANLDNLIAWVSEYEVRPDEYGLQRHRRLFDTFRGRKFELRSVLPDAAQGGGSYGGYARRRLSASEAAILRHEAA